MTVVGNTPTRRCTMKRAGIMAVLSIAMGFLVSGCLWGIVTDAETGDPVGYIDVKWEDSHGHWGQTTTDSHGLYVFDVREGDAIPVPGPVDFYVYQHYGVCGAPTQERLVEYDDRPASTPPADPWEIQNFTVACPEFSRPTVVVPPATPSPTKTPVPAPTSTPTPASRFRPLPTATPIPRLG
jgi:hypothetical protein